MFHLNTPHATTALPVGSGEHSIAAPPKAAHAEVDLESAYAEYGPYVARLALRLLGRTDEADDLVHDVFLAAAEKKAQLRDGSAVKFWLASIAVNKAKNRLRVRRLRRFFSLDTTGPELFATRTPPGMQAESRMILERVFQALDNVPPEYRLAWSLRYLEEESLQQCAAICGVSLATVKRHVASAQNVIEQELRDV